MRQPSAAEICEQLEIRGGSPQAQAAAKAVVSAALAESLKLGPVAVRDLQDWSKQDWNAVRLRRSPKGS